MEMGNGFYGVLMKIVLFSELKGQKAGLSPAVEKVEIHR